MRMTDTPLDTAMSLGKQELARLVVEAEQRVTQLEFAQSTRETILATELGEMKLILEQTERNVARILWRPIKTCPPGEDKFLAYQPDRGIYECWWHEDHRNGGYWMDRADSDPEPTHWMPLPPSPVS